MDKLIREEYYKVDDKIYLIRVIFTGDNYIVSGYIDDNLINETKYPSDSEEELNADSPQIDNLIYILKEDLLDYRGK